MLEKCRPPRPPPLVLESLISWQRGCRTSADTKVFIATGSCTTPSFQPSSPAPTPRPLRPN